MSKVKRISKTGLEEGIAISLKTAARHLDAAEVLVNNNLLDNAVASIEFAIEEFGRAVYLRERLQIGLETIEKSLETGRRAHELKYDKAFSVLPTDLKTIWEDTIYGYFPKGYWLKNYWHRGYWGERTVHETISPSTRLDAIFTYFDEKTQTWHNGINADERKIKAIVNALRKTIRDFSI
jgi:hypothetical protein